MSEQSGTQHEALRLGTRVPTAYHTIGGKHPDGKPIAIGPWTFECPQVRRVVEAYLSGPVLNACAGKTRLAHPNIHRNDLDDRRYADFHHDVTELDEHLEVESFDVIVFDPPFDSDQAEEHYDGRTVGRGPSGGIWQARDALARLTAPGGLVLSIGWNSVGLKHKASFERWHAHVFQREQKPDVFLTVDQKTQTTLVTDGGNRYVDTGISRLDEAGPYEDDDLPYMNFECPVCQLAICEWTRCPGCHWYDDDIWQRTMNHYSDCRECGQTIGGGDLCDDCDRLEVET